MFFIRFTINVLALLAVFLLVWNIQGDNIVLIAIVMAVGLSVINVFIRPIVLLLTLPANLLTFRCLGIVINAGLVCFAARPVRVPGGLWRAGPGGPGVSCIAAALRQAALRR